jgi:hypothetical protein
VPDIDMRLALVELAWSSWLDRAELVQQLLALSKVTPRGGRIVGLVWGEFG